MNKENIIKNNDEIEIVMFGKKKIVNVISTGDNQFDKDGNYKEDDFELNEMEVKCLNWFVSNIKIEDYKKEILDYCNYEYRAIGEKQITINDLEEEIDIHTIAINITETWKSKDGFVYPEISFLGECKCNPEHGICIGFRDGKFLGIESQDWTL